MDWLKAKYYERKIKKNLNNRKYEYIIFEYFLLVSRGFTMHYVKPNTRDKVTVKFKYGYNQPYETKTFKNIKQAYLHFCCF